MAKLIYLCIASLDGYVADREGNFGWAHPDEEVHGFVNDLVRGVGTYLYGRRMYETMAVWETLETQSEPECVRDFAQIWRTADKVVYSSRLESVATPRTRLERTFDAGALEQRKALASSDLAVGGASIAAQAIAAGLVDEYQMLLAPAIVGGGTRFLPDDVRIDLQLLNERRFSSGFAFLRYRVR